MDLLKQSATGIREIAFACGFRDLAHPSEH
jgi:transcriptional regulator GlxA family with amidase domain